MIIRGKFTVTEHTTMSWSKDARRIKLTAQYDERIEEDRKFAKATPSAEIIMTVDNPVAVEALAIGGQFYVDFIPVEEGAK